MKYEVVSNNRPKKNIKNSKLLSKYALFEEWLVCYPPPTPKHAEVKEVLETWCEVGIADATRCSDRTGNSRETR